MMKKRILSFVLMIILIFGNVTPISASSLKLVYNGKETTYTGKQIKIVYDGKNVSMSKTPGILMGSAGYAMVPYYEAFVKSNIKATKSYNSTTKVLTLTYNDNTLKMRLNQKTAYINGEKLTLPVAPVNVTYKNSGVTRILVPARAVVSALQIGSYVWNSGASTIVISSNDSVSVSTGTSGSAKSFIYNGKSYTLSKRAVTYNGSVLSLDSTPACVISGYNMVPYYNAFVKNGPKIKRSYSSSTKKLVLTNSLSGNNNQLTMKVNSRTAYLNGTKITLPKAPVMIKFSPKGSNVIYVPAKAVATLLGFSYSYNSTTKTMSFVPGLSIRTGSTYSVYTRTKVTVKANSVKVSSKIPGILDGNTTLIPASATFNKKYDLGVTYTYSSKKATLKRGTTTIVLTIGSNKASINGVTKTMPAEAKLIYLPSTKKNYVMVPGEFVSESLGLRYQYSAGVSSISVPTVTDDSSSLETPDNGSNSFQATITLARPSSIAQGEISCSDDYHNRQLIITMPGDQTDYYSTHKPSLPSGVSFSAKYSSSKDKTSLYFETSKINGFKVKEDSSHIYIQNGTPTSMFQNVIVIDAGHGGSDSGATGNGYKEKDFTLSIVKAAKTYFDTNSNYKVYYTRLSDTYPSISERYALANEVKADIFISVHINSYSETSKGTETLYNPNRNKKNTAGLSCSKLASYVQKYILASTGFTDRGLKERTDLGVLNNNNGPATLTEIGFISNPNEASKMASNLKNYGKAVYDSVVYASSQYPTGR